MILDPKYDGPASVADKLYSLYHSGTHGAYMNLIDYNADLILVAREPSADELEAASRANIELEVYPIALDAFVFLKNSQNPVDELSLDQIRAIYTGELTHWDQIGGKDELIHTYQRNENSGSQELMQSLVMGDTQMIESPDMILETMMGPISAISSDPLGIGYSVYYYAENMVPRDEIELLAINGIHPKTGTIGDRSYPLTTEVYAVVRAGTPRHYGAGLLLEWLRTDSGQTTVAKSGYIPVNN
jgi:phosphate transport system substrate-binding protein